MIKKKESKISYNFLWLLLVVTVIFSSELPGINFPGIGFLYPFRMIVPFLFLFSILNSNNKRTKVIGLTIILFLVWIAYGMLTMLWTPNLINFIKQMGNYLFGFMLVVSMILLIKDKELLKKIILFVFVLLLLLSFGGIYESFTGNYFSTAGANFHDRIYSTNLYSPLMVFGNPNDFCFVLFAFLPFICYATKYTKFKFKYTGLFIRVIYFFMYCVITYLASCRMGMILIPFLFYINLFFCKRKIVPIALTAFIFLVLVIDGLFNVIGVVDRIIHEARILIWKDIFVNIAHFKFLGTGAGNSYIKLPNEIYSGHLTNPHFWFYEVFAEFGFVVTGMLLFWYASIFRWNYLVLGEKKHCLNKKVYVKNNNTKDISNNTNVTNKKVYVTNKKAITLNNKLHFDETLESKSMSKAVIIFMLCFIVMSVMSSSISSMPTFWFLIAITVIITNINLKDDNKDITKKFNYLK